MGTLAIAVAYVLFVWWFSTGAVLLLVGLSARHDALLKSGAVVLAAASLAGIVASSSDTTAAGAYCAFTCAILLWGAVEISLLAGWITGPRPQRCPSGVAGAERVGFALDLTRFYADWRPQTRDAAGISGDRLYRTRSTVAPPASSISRTRSGSKSARQDSSMTLASVLRVRNATTMEMPIELPVLRSNA